MRYIFTVTPGRSGQASLTDLVERCGIGVVPAFEEPQAHVRLPGVLGDIERRFRRRFIETHELLGRGDVLRAFAAQDIAALQRYAEARFAWMQRFAPKTDIFFDISKFFIRGLHRQLVALAGRPKIVLLIRDPLLNMRSFVNRGKDFRLDNNSPADTVNELRMPADMPPSGLYLWAWTEGYLRGLRLAEEAGLDAPRCIFTRELENADAMAGHFSALEIPFQRIEIRKAMNTNESQGHGRTELSLADIEAFERWREAVPAAIWDRLHFMRGYDPRQHLEIKR
ncbi:hypothetical protein [Ferrovibrio sp.]|uniref:hypothetical protein n=1 Tax=Ferrovibrio sp. TaxID=1917215 RepID=UPI0025BFADAF|nr:hypothetical protein [Ferrovibrio sp.]MBX3456237.1 hypothetical protein [Ferrovibrio sp.]